MSGHVLPIPNVSMLSLWFMRKVVVSGQQEQLLLISTVPEAKG